MLSNIELEQTVKNTDIEKANLQALINTQDEKGKSAMDEITKALTREQEKDKEISSLQKGKVRCNFYWLLN